MERLSKHEPARADESDAAHGQTRISFIVPIFNGERHLGGCTQSILGQRLEAGTFEVLLIDDGSTDGTEALARKIAAEHPSVRLISQPNAGVSSARNRGLEEAKGEFIWFVDVDDRVVEASASRLLHVASSGRLDVLTFRDLTVDEGREYQSTFVDNLKASPELLGTEHIAVHGFKNAPWFYIVRRECIRRNNFRFTEGRYCEDVMFNVELFAAAQRVAHYDSPAYVYVRRPDSLTNRRALRHLLRYADDFQFAAEHINRVIERDRSCGSDGYLGRLRSRRDSLVFFSALRLLDRCIPVGLALSLYDRLWAAQLLPVRSMRTDEYPGARYAILKFVVNRRSVFRFLVRARHWLGNLSPR